MIKKISSLFKRVVLASRSLSSLLLYSVLGGFIMGWWALAFHPVSSNQSPSIQTSQSLALKTAALLEELSPLQRDALHRALAGDFPSMLHLIDQWEQDALLLTNKGVSDIQRLDSESYLQAHALGRLIQDSSDESLHQLNCKMNLEWMHDDNGRLLRIEDHFQRFLPQTYLAASFLLAIAPPKEIIALPKGLRLLKQLYPPHILTQIPTDISHIHSERLYLNRPHLAFVAPYSHPPALEVLRHQQIELYSINHVNTIKDIQEALLKVGHASNHVLEAQLLSIFMEATLISIDNRFRALKEQMHLTQSPQKFLYLSHREHYAIPTTKTLTGQLMARALTHCPHLSCMIPTHQNEWRIPFEQEKILQSAPDVMIISTYADPKSITDPFLKETQAFESQQIFYIDEVPQESPTQYIALAYFDLFQALATTYTRRG